MWCLDRAIGDSCRHSRIVNLPGPTEVEARMRKIGYSWASTWNITDKLKQEGLVEHLEQQGAYRITLEG